MTHEPVTQDPSASLSLRQRLARAFGKDLDPGVQLPSAVREETSSTAADVLRRIGEHQPPTSRYQMLGEIARGGMGVILKVWDQDLRRNLAMKVVRPDGRPSRDAGSVDEKVLVRFLEEAQITGQLDHPGIVPVHELGLDSASRIFFTMPLVKGRELKQIIPLARDEREGWSIAKVLQVLLKVCEAVAYAHAKGVVHRDLKPSNVMVGRYGETYVMDWGLARVLGREDTRDLRLQEAVAQTVQVRTDRREAVEQDPESPLVTLDGDVIGTPAYMAPEQARGDMTAVGPRSDVYAIGAILYHLLTGTPPYVPHGAAIAPRALLAALLYGPPKPVRELAPEAPVDLADVCAKAMEREPEKRYANALELAADLENHLAGRRVLAREVTLAYAWSLAYRRYRPAFLTAAAALLVFAAWLAADVLDLRTAKVAAETAREETQRLSDLATAELLVQQEAELYPTTPAMLPRLRDWVRTARDVLGREALHRGAAASLAPAAPSGPESRGERPVEILRDLARVLPRVEERIHAAEELPGRTALQPQWTAAIASIAQLPVYGRARIEPQLGLLPLQLHPATGLWEFWLVQSGEKPRIADPRTGALELTPRAAIVLVLVPGGDGLAPFFLGKHEVTQGQWVRAMDTNLALYQAGDVPLDNTGVVSDPVVTLLHPIESVSWFDAERFARRLDCSLPTHEQWELACAAGSSSDYHWGDRVDDLQERENVRTYELPDTNPDLLPYWDDGWTFHAPVGSFEANAFGLHDMHGNVQEWCSDWRIQPGVERERRKHVRGGSWFLSPLYATTWFQHSADPRSLNNNIGFRVARELRPVAPPR